MLKLVRLIGTTPSGRLATIDLSVQQPYYFPRMPNMQGSIALIGALDRAFGIATPVDSLQKAADDQHAVLEAEMEHSEELKSLVMELEQRYDSTYSGGGRVPSELLGELPTAGEVIRDIEALFRRRTENPGRE